jgi:hypothetical protein
MKENKVFWAGAVEVIRGTSEGSWNIEVKGRSLEGTSMGEVVVEALIFGDAVVNDG